MGHYVQHTLHLNEEIIFRPHRHWVSYLDIYFQLSLLYIIFCESMNVFIANTMGEFIVFFEKSEKIIGFLILLRITYLFIRNYSIEMVITNYRVVYKIGIIHIYSEEITNDKIESVAVNQSLLGRILNYGDIVFTGTGTGRLVFPTVYAPWWIKTKIEDIVRQAAYENRRAAYYNQQQQRFQDYRHRQEMSRYQEDNRYPVPPYSDDNY